MGKAERGTIKDLANRMKAKGLQKLRWYCQVCEKQCRDENGFKCHVMSESHMRQIKLVGQNADKHIKNFSREFLNEFVNILSRRYGTRRVFANGVYQEYIRDRNHIHMNATVWHSLSEFVIFLGKEGICKVDQTEKGWFIQWIDNSPEALAKRDLEKKKIRMDVDSEKLSQTLIEKQIERAYSQMKEQNPERESEALSHILDLEGREDNNEKITFGLDAAGSSSKTHQNSTAEPVGVKKRSNPAFFGGEEEEEQDDEQRLQQELEAAKRHGKTKNLDEILRQEESRKKVKYDHWLFPGIIVRVVNQSLANGKYFRSKGLVEKVVDQYGAQIKIMDEDGDVLLLDQDDLETVVPPIDSIVLILNGMYRGLKATVLSLNKENYKCMVQMIGGPFKGVKVSLPYEDVCKLK